MKHRFTYLFIFLLAFSPLSCGEKIEPGTTAKSPPVITGVSVATTQMTEQPLIYVAVGTVKAGISSKLSSKLLGTVEAIRVREGDRVKQGDVLLIMDQRQVKADVRKSEAGLSEAKNALDAAISSREAATAAKELALATYERYQKLIKERLVSAQAFEEHEERYHQAEAALKKAEADVDAASARINQAKASLSGVQVTGKDAVITAPHDGIISEKFVDKGDLAKPGTPLLALETTSGFCVDVVLPETYIYYVEPLQEVSVEVPALKTGPLWGNVCTIVPSADPTSRSFIVKINLLVEKKVRSGMFARVKIPIGSTTSLLIPQKAVVTRGQLTGIFLVDSDSIAHFRLIRPGKSSGDFVEVLSGLKKGDRYVVGPTLKLKDGVQVEVTP